MESEKAGMVNLVAKDWSSRLLDSGPGRRGALQGQEQYRCHGDTWEGQGKGQGLQAGVFC